jgi:hypothetical protein
MMMKKRKLMMLSICFMAFYLGTGSLDRAPYIQENHSEQSAQTSMAGLAGLPWERMSVQQRYGYYERLLLNVFMPYISEAIQQYYGESRQYDNGKILSVKPKLFAHEIVVEVETFTGPHNPPYGIETITLLLDSGKIEVTGFQHRDEESD